MPPRKSGGDAGQVSSSSGGAAAATPATPGVTASGPEAGATDEASTSTPAKSGEKDKEKEKDGVNVEKDAVLAMSKSATVFVSYLTSHANDLAMAQNKKTIMPQNVFDALSETEFEDFIPRLEAELAKYTEHQNEKRTNSRKKVAADKAPPNGTSSPKAPTDGRAGTDGENDGDPPAAKKARRSTFGGADGSDGDAVADGEDQPHGSADDTVSEEEADATIEEDEESEDDAEGPGEEEEPPLGEEGLDTQDVEPPDEDGSENSDDSD